MLAPALFVVGLALVVAAIAQLAGLWWGVLAGGLVLVAVAVLTQIGNARSEARERSSDR